MWVYIYECLCTHIYIEALKSICICKYAIITDIEKTNKPIELTFAHSYTQTNIDSNVLTYTIYICM